ncbi:hypothetical protein Tco_0950185 [Tanacetum coccineum]
MKNTTVSPRFKSISNWNLDFCIRDCITELAILGILPQLWLSDLFTSISKHWAKVLIPKEYCPRRFNRSTGKETNVETNTLLNGYYLSSSSDDENSFLGDGDIEGGDFGDNDNINGDDGNQSDDDDKSGNDEENSSDDVYETKGDPKVAKCSGCRVSKEFLVDHSEEGSTSVPDHEVNDKTPLLNVVHIMSVGDTESKSMNESKATINWVKKPNGKSSGIVAVWDTSWFSLNSSLEGDSRMISLTSSLSITPYVLGDFNEVRFSHERMGPLFDGRGASAFNNFIPVTGLLDLPLGAKNNNIFHGAIVGKDKVHILHLQFADDALIMGKWSLLNAKNLSRILTCFHLASGLKEEYWVGDSPLKCSFPRPFRLEPSRGAWFQIEHLHPLFLQPMFKFITLCHLTGPSNLPSSA